jgi:hypothetical protein
VPKTDASTLCDMRGAAACARTGRCTHTKARQNTPHTRQHEHAACHDGMRGSAAAAPAGTCEPCGPCRRRRRSPAAPAAPAPARRPPPPPPPPPPVRGAAAWLT